MTPLPRQNPSQLLPSPSPITSSSPYFAALRDRPVQNHSPLSPPPTANLVLPPPPLPEKPFTMSTSSSLSTVDPSSSSPAAAATKAPPPGRNWYFIFIRLILVEVALVVTFGSVIYVWQAANSLNIFGCVLDRESTTDQALNNIWRHISVIWFSFAPASILIATNLTRFGPFLVLHALTHFCAGLARLWTAFRIGIPGTPMGYFLVYITTFFDLSTPPFVMLLFFLGRRCEARRNAYRVAGDQSPVDPNKKTN